MKKKAIKNILVILIVLTSCSLFQSETETVNDLLPRDTDVPGWMKIVAVSEIRKNEIKNYNREYEGTGIEKLAFCIYKSLDNPVNEIKLEILKFENSVDAYGFYSIRRGPGLFEISDMNENYTNTLAIVQTGEYVFYAVTEKIESLLKNDLKTFVNIPVLYIGKNYKQNAIPAKLNILRGADGYGILYSKKPYHRFPFLNNICFTQWTWNKKLIDVFLSESDSFHGAYQLFVKSTENGYIITSSNNLYTAFKKESDDTYSFISVNDRWIFGCWSVRDVDEGKRILGEIMSKIQDYKKKSLSISFLHYIRLNNNRVNP